MEQMWLELTLKRMSGHGVVLSADIFHAMILMRIYKTVTNNISICATYLFKRITNCIYLFNSLTCNYLVISYIQINAGYRFSIASNL